MICVEITETLRAIWQKDMQVSFNNFDTDTNLDTVTGIKVDWRHNLEIIRPKVV